MLNFIPDTPQPEPSAFSWATAIGASENPFAIAIARYQRAPIAFIREVLGVVPDEWQTKALRAIAKGETRISIRSCHGPGKTALASWLLLWFACTRAPFKAAVTAPTSAQLFDVLWPELMRWFNVLPEPWRKLWDKTSDHLTLKSDAESFITARTSRPEQPESLQGIHSAHVLIVVDEASGVDERIFESAAGSMSTANAITLLIGNPTRASGYFWSTHMLNTNNRWWTLRVGYLDSPRVSKSFVEEMEERYGRDSNVFRVRCLGEFPTSDDDTLIPAGLVDEAMSRVVPPDLGAGIVWGVDVARFGNDASCLVKRAGKVVLEPPRRWHGLDTMQLAGAVKAEYDMSAAARPAIIVVDAIGIGAGVADRLMEQSVPVLALNVAEQSSTVGRYARLRDELWVRCREWLETRSVSLPKDDRLRADLLSPRFSFLSTGVLKVEGKEQMRMRGLPSPDSADALIGTFSQAAIGITSGVIQGGLYDQRPVRPQIAGME
jgi:hypothetical protein